MTARVVVLLDGRYLAQDQPKGLVAALREVNEFPNYTAVPDADELLADHVLGSVVQEAA